LDTDVGYDSPLGDGKPSYFYKIVTREVTRIINLPVPKDHNCAGITGCLKNLAFGSVNNTARFHPGPHFCDPMIGEICAHPAVRGKVVLHVMDALKGVYDGGPAANPNATFELRELWMGRDPVAMDSVLLGVIDAERQKGRKAPIGQGGATARHIETAAKLGLGVASPDAARVVRVERIADLYSAHLNPSLVTLMRFMGFETAEGHSHGHVVTSDGGAEYIDFLGGFGVFSMGHTHDRIVDAVCEQIRKAPLSSRLLLSEVAARLGGELARITPGDLTYTFLCNSGAEAVEGALKLARFATRRPGFVSALNAFHGKTLGALSVSGRGVYRDPFQPLLPGVTHVPFGDAGALAAAVTEETAAVILEPIQGEAGVIVPPEGYLRAAREICDARGALLILDEVQTGMGRTGRNFACEWEGVVPDVMTLGKALGGGVMPIGAFVARSECWGMFRENPLMHSSTFGGGPAACAAALAAIEVLESEDLAAQALAKGEPFRAKLREVALAHTDIIDGVRGRGLMTGVSFTNSDVGGLVIAGMAQRGVLVAYTLNNQKVMRFQPPLNVPDEVLGHVADCFAAVVEQTLELIEGLEME
jgi:putrescine aminotransferase